MKKLLVATLAWGLIITGCSESDKKDTSTADFDIEPLTKSAWLFESLPENTVAYARIPNIWAGFSAKDDSFKYALGNKEHVKAVRQIQQGVYDNILAKLDEKVKPLAEFYAKHTVAPVELAFVSQNGQPVSFVATQLDYKSDQEFNDAIVNLTQGIPSANLMPNDGEATGVIGFGPGSAIYYRYDSGSQKLTLISGMGASITSLENAAATIKPNKKHEMLKLEQDIDSSHEGLFVWVSPKNAMPFMQMAMPPEKLQQLKELGVDQAKGLAVGYGVSDGKTRLKFLLDMPKVGINSFLPSAKNVVDIKSVGTPKWAFHLSTPGSSQTKKIVNRLNKSGALNVGSWEDLNSETEKNLGLKLNTLLDAFGPEVVIFQDEVGTFASVRYKKTDLTTLLKKTKEHLDISYKTHSKEGTEVHHLTFSVISKGLEGIQAPIENSKSVISFEIMKNYRENYFWVVEDDQLIFARVPQLLLERSQRKPTVDVANWLQEEQGYNAKSAIMGFSASVDDLSRSSYHYYLELLMILSDFTEADIDLLSLPTANQLGFSDKGALGFSLRSDDDIFGLEFTFENGATDIMVGAGGATTVAVVGILAAVAVPAYMDYTVRAQMVSGEFEVETLKLQIAESLASGAKVEDIDNGFEGIKEPEEYATSVIEKMVVNDGVITVFFSNPTLGNGPQTIAYVPMFDEQHINYWDCSGGTVARKYRPARCK